MGYLLALESSCDESAAAVIEMETGRPAASVVYSQIDLHRRYGGVVPEIASRDHLRRMPGVVEEAMQQAAIGWDSIEVVAATRGPGLATSLLVGWTMAKGIAAALGVPVVGVNHLVGHLASLGLSPDMPDGSMSLPDPLTSCGPTVILLVSGGHTALVLNQGLHDRRLLGQTIDDAAGEAYDKVAKILELGYPGGPIVDRLAQAGNPEAFRLPRSFLDGSTPDEHRYNFSFSGLKTAVLYQVRRDPECFLSGGETSTAVRDLCASFQAAVVDVLVRKLLRAADAQGVGWIGAAGGVSLNHGLRAELQHQAAAQGKRLLLAPASVCTDNALMIGLAGRTQFLCEGAAHDQGDVDPGWSL